MNEETLKEAAGPYNAALKENGYNYYLNLKYTPSYTRQESRANPIEKELNEAEPNHYAYCIFLGRNTRTMRMNVATNIGNNFFLLLNECVPKNNIRHKIFNRNTIKLS